MRQEEKDRLDHVIRNRLLAIEAHMRGIRKEIRQIEDCLDSLKVNGLTKLGGSGTIR